MLAGTTFPAVGASYHITFEPFTNSNPTVSPLQKDWLVKPVGAAVGLIVAFTAVRLDVHVASAVST